MRDDDRRVRLEEDAAASEAARIGGRSGMEGMDEAKRSTAEHGGGEQEADPSVHGEADKADSSETRE